MDVLYGTRNFLEEILYANSDIVSDDNVVLSD